MPLLYVQPGERDRAGFVIDVREIGIGEAPELAKLLHKSMQDYQPVWLREWKGPEQDAIDYGKHDSRRADSERQRSAA